MSKKLTPWFPDTVKPVRKGVYEVESMSAHNRAFAYWNGLRFGYRCWDYADMPDPIGDAYDMRDGDTVLPPFSQWRGLAKEPK